MQFYAESLTLENGNTDDTVCGNISTISILTQRKTSRQAHVVHVMCRRPTIGRVNRRSSCRISQCRRLEHTTSRRKLIERTFDVNLLRYPEFHILRMKECIEIHGCHVRLEIEGNTFTVEPLRSRQYTNLFEVSIHLCLTATANRDNKQLHQLRYRRRRSKGDAIIQNPVNIISLIRTDRILPSVSHLCDSGKVGEFRLSDLIRTEFTNWYKQFLSAPYCCKNVIEVFLTE